mmetsp:Transcript_31578/g.79199  ORF Transcript_31578/g.79199 Transcript_31578/m.79199 type:complete len:232 (+) Transcript_31578:305-1000(+)
MDAASRAVQPALHFHHTHSVFPRRRVLCVVRLLWSKCAGVVVVRQFVWRVCVLRLLRRRRRRVVLHRVCLGVMHLGRDFVVVCIVGGVVVVRVWVVGKGGVGRMLPLVVRIVLGVGCVRLVRLVRLVVVPLLCVLGCLGGRLLLLRWWSALWLLLLLLHIEQHFDAVSFFLGLLVLLNRLGVVQAARVAECMVTIGAAPPLRRFCRPTHVAPQIASCGVHSALSPPSDRLG